MKYVQSSLLTFVIFTLGCSSFAANGLRDKISLQEWQFCADQTPVEAEPILPQQANWTSLTLPHVFRLSGLPEDSAGWYYRTFTAETADKGKRLYLFLEGAGAVADVYVNGQHVGQHRGAFTAAAFDLTPAVKFGQGNELLVRVTNREPESANCLSWSNLYYTSGGLYRPAWLLKTSAVHIYPDMGSTGVYLTPKNITDTKADLEVRTVLRNSTDKPADVLVKHTVTDSDGKVCARFKAAASIPADTVQTTTAVEAITKPKLWDIGKPNLYSVRTEVLAGGKLVDVLTERTGFRTIAMDNGRFMINGKELLSRGGVQAPSERVHMERHE